MFSNHCGCNYKLFFSSDFFRLFDKLTVILTSQWQCVVIIGACVQFHHQPPAPPQLQSLHIDMPLAMAINKLFV